MSKGRVILLGTQALSMDSHGRAPEISVRRVDGAETPAKALCEAGYEVVLATSNGQTPHVAAASDAFHRLAGENSASDGAGVFPFTRYPSVPRSLRSIIDEGLEGFDGVFAAGEYAFATELMQDQDAGRILRHFHETAKPTAMLGHGPMILTAAMPHTREFCAALMARDLAKAAAWAKAWQYAGYRMTVFVAGEEPAVDPGLPQAKICLNMPFALSLAGAEVSNAPVDSEPFVIEDRELITGQNFPSAHAIVAALIAALERNRGENIAAA